MQEQAQAYDLAQFATEEFNVLRVVENKSAAQEKRRRALRMVERVVTCALVLALLVSVLYSRSQLTAMSDRITRLETQLVEEQSICDQLTYQLESDATLSKIEDYASRQLGMVKTDKSQVTYVSLVEENCVDKAENALTRCWNTMCERLKALMVYLGI